MTKLSVHAQRSVRPQPERDRTIDVLHCGDLDVAKGSLGLSSYNCTHKRTTVPLFLSGKRSDGSGRPRESFTLDHDAERQAQDRAADPDVTQHA